MTLSDILKASANRIRSNGEAAAYVGGEKNLQTLRAAKFVKPWKENGRDTQWDTAALDQAIERVNVEGWPK